MVVEAARFAFDMSMMLSVQTHEGARDIPIVYVGDFNFGYTSANLIIGSPPTTTTTRLLASGYWGGTVSYASDPTTEEWEAIRSPAPYAVGPGVFFDSHLLTGAEYGGRQRLDDTDMHVVSGRLPGSRDGVRDLGVTYWVGVSDGLIRQVDAVGALDISDDTTLPGGITPGAGTFTLTVSFSDYGKDVPVVLPALSVPILSHTALPLDDGRVLVSGGFTGVANNNFIAPFPLSLVQLYDISSETWTIVEPVQGHSVATSAVRTTDGSVLLVGLGFGDETSGATSLLDAATTSMELLPSRATRRGFPDLVLLADGRVLAAGGIDFGGPQSFGVNAVDTVEIFDPRTGEWHQAAPMLEAVEDQSLVLLRDGRVLAVLSDPGLSAVYDPANDVWEPIAQPAVSYSRPRAVRLSDGRVLVTGANRSYSLPDLCNPDFVGGNVLPIDELCGLATSEVYDPATDTWTTTGPMIHERILHTLTLLPDGRVLAVGGDDPMAAAYAPYSTTELFDPRTNSWTPGPDLTEARYRHSATLLPDGRILLIGGIGQEREPDPPTDDKEIYVLTSVEVLVVPP